MTRREALVAVAALTASCARWAERPRARAEFLAFSFSAAARRLKAGLERQNVDAFGGLQHLIGAVFDANARDLVVVGFRRDGVAGALNVDDFIAAVRAILVAGTWPLVSIDRTPATATTGKQQVRFEGVSDSAFSAHLLAADVALKKLSLGLLSAHGVPLRSLFEMCEEAARNDTWADAVASRLWFHGAESSLLVRSDVALVRALRVGVKTEMVGGPAGARDEVSERYAAQFTQHVDQVAALLPEVNRLTALFEMVGVAKGLESFEGLDLGYWLHEYQLPRVAVPSEYALIRKTRPVETRRGPRVLELEGGIDMTLLRRRLAAGDQFAFRDATLRSRPAPDALTWPVPLAGWRFVESGWEPDGGEAAARPVGVHLDRRLVDLPTAGDPPRGGVNANVVVRPEDFGRRP